MINITPQGDIYLCKTPLENDYKNQLTFTNANAQMTYFNSKIFKTLNNYTYIKHDNIIKVGFPIDEIIDCNYLFYRNEGFTTKYYFCFITNMEYINENCTSITFETDVWQTYQFNIVYNPSFIEREHVNDDTIGLHTVPENLETGEYITQSNNNTSIEPVLTNMYYLSDTVIIAGVTTIGFSVAYPLNAQQSMYNGVYSGLTFLAFKTAKDLRLYINNCQENLSNDNIATLFIAPDKLTGLQQSDYITTTVSGDIHYSFTFAFVPSSEYEKDLGEFSYPKADHLDNNYVPRNKKLLTFPYCFLNVTNNVGITKDYHYEEFNTSVCKFELRGALSVGCSIKCYPKEYAIKSNITNFENKLHAMDGAKLPTCAWLNDAYTNWLTQNSVNIGLGIAQDIVKIGASFIKKDVGSVTGGYFGIANTLASIYEHSLQPPTAKGGASQGDLIFAERNTFNTYPTSIKKEYAEIIDKYFDMFGYKVNIVKVPNITGRTNWNYVKTIDCNFEGDIPGQFLQIIKRIFNNGITLWHNPNTMYNYNNTNNIVS